MGGSTQQTMPAPVDYSAAMMMKSDNDKNLALASIGSQTMQNIMNSSVLSDAVNAHLELGMERYGTEQTLAHEGAQVALRAESNRHDEAMAQIEKGGEVSTADTSDFLT